ncbi:MAG: hypothetical protein HY079_11395 [Elusimicrobia bacterium]|nr:hypothetical protein [Elusimicrobiota bacterium]
MRMRATLVRAAALAAAAAVGAAAPAAAHCDGVDGPVVASAREALATGDRSLALMWVRSQDEGEVERAFTEAVAVRALGPAARGLADRSFFETVVRLHRAGEGAPYTGLKPAGRDLGPAIPAADAALASGSVDALWKLLGADAERGLRERFRTAVAKRRRPAGDVAAGREYARAYVDFVHYAEGLRRAAAGAGGGEGEGEEDAHAQRGHREP